MGSVFARVFSLKPKAARKELSLSFGEQLQRWTSRAEVNVSDLATLLGFERPHLYKLFNGDLPFHAGWLYLLPPALLRLVLDDLAASIGYELRPAAPESLPADYDHSRDSCDYLRELTDCVRARAEHEANGELTPQEIEAELREIEQAEAVLEQRKAFLRAALAQRGGRVQSIVERLTKRSA